MIAAAESISTDECDLFDLVRRWPQYPSLRAITAEGLQSVTAERGIDFSTALLFDRIMHSPEHGEFIRRIDSMRRADESQPPHTDATVAVVPGAFYSEYPHTGAGGEVILDAAKGIGFRTARIPTDSTGTAGENGRLICRWLEQRRGETVILTSLSKGGSDLKMALAEPGMKRRFQNVIGWINVGGILDGSPMASWILRRKLRALGYRLLFFGCGKRFELLTSLERRPGSSLDFEVSLPEKVHLINVMGFPLRRHLTSRRARRWHQRLGEYGPNESVTLLHDALRLPGHLLPVWGVDHYFQDGWDATRLIRTLLNYVTSESNWKR